ncbi:MAG: hypothetical protein ACR2JV_06970 [Gaiellales bacterium]
MHTPLRNLLISLAVATCGLALVAPSRAAVTTIAYALPSADPSGITAQTAPGIAGCIAGCAQLRLVRGAAVAARRQGLLAFAAPAGTSIVQATLRLRYRTRQAAVSAHLLGRYGGRWIDSRRLRSTAGTTATVATGRGATAVAVSLTADAAVPARTVKADGDNTVSVDSVHLVVQDASAPTVAWAGDDAAGPDWRRGTICGAFASQDAGLGVDRVEYAVGGAVAIATAPPGGRLQPRPLAFGGNVCLDTAQLPDGTYGTTLTAVDTGAEGNRSTPVGGSARIDNTAPVVAYTAPADPESRLPLAHLAVQDGASGIARVAAAIDGIPATLRTLGGDVGVTPAAPVADGLHRITWEVADAAGNVTTGAETFGIADVTPPTIDTAAPTGVVGPLAPIVAHATDTGAGIAPDGWRLAVDGVDVTAAADLDGSGSIAYTPTRPWGEGDHVVRLTVADRSGNRVVRTWSFSLPVTPTPPAPAPAAPATPTEATAPMSSGPDPTADAPETDLRPARRVELRTSAQRTRAGGEVRLHGRVAGVRATRLRIEARVGSGWRLVATVPIDRAGRFATPVRLPSAGRYAVRARVGDVTSAVVRLIAR